MKHLIAKIKKMHGLDKYIVFCFSILIAFATAEMIVSTLTGVLHDTLITMLFGCMGGELLLCAVIKRFKLKRGDE